MSYKLFLDDFRYPEHCIAYMGHSVDTSIYRKEWIICRNYNAFVKTIEEKGLPEFISFDHDLAEGHYHNNMQEGILNYDSNDFDNNEYKTGYHCAKWLIEYCNKNNNGIIPDYVVHSMNQVGKRNIIGLLMGV